jgi:lipid-A-disaccharide synthase
VKYFLIAGEASGDLHGSALMQALRSRDVNAEFRYFGGDKMQQQGGVLLRHYREMAFMGGIEVLMNVRKIKSNLDLCRNELTRQIPDVLILIDYPSFNMKIAQFAHKNGIKVFWFIAPKVWAWKAWRIKQLKAYVDEIFTILPFEKDYFSKHSLNVHYVGNPIVDQIQAARKNFRTREKFLADNGLNEKPVIALLPGSRVQEVKYLLPVMAKMSNEFSDYQFVISGAPSLSPSIYHKFSANNSLPVLFDQTYELLHNSRAALVTSGTATLETAFMNVPQVILYKMMGNKISYKIFRYFFLKVNYISLPNLVLGREIVKELVMHEMNFQNTRIELDKLLTDAYFRQKMLDNYALLQKETGEAGAAERAAVIMYGLLRKH